MLSKSKPLKSDILRESARGEACTLRFHCCDGGGETTVLAHLRHIGGGGIGQKPSDLRAVYACGHCHDALDGRSSEWIEARDWSCTRALAETHERMLATGALRIRRYAPTDVPPDFIQRREV